MDALIARITSRFQFLSEAGRVLSARNERRLRAADENLAAVLAELGDAEVKEAERTYMKRMQLLDDAVRTQYRTPTTWASLVDIFDDRVVYSLADRSMGEEWMPGAQTLYQVDYTIDDADGVTFGQPMEVVARTVYEPVSSDEEVVEESGEQIEGDVIPLIERAVSSDGTTLIKVIAPGWGSSGYYPADVLERDGPKVFPAGTHMYLDHPTERERRELPERSVTKLAGVTTEAARWMSDHPAGPGLYARARISPTHRNDIDALAEHIGTSIMAGGTYEVGEADGRKGKIITSLTRGDSIDFVTRAGAGGKVLSMMESRRGAADAEQSPLPTMEESAMTEQELAALRAEMQQLRESNARLQEARELSNGATVVDRVLATHKDLHEATITRLAEALKNRVVITDGALDVTATQALVEQAVTAERAYLGAIVPTGQVRNVGASEPKTYGADELAEAFKDFGLPAELASVAARAR